MEAIDEEKAYLEIAHEIVLLAVLDYKKLKEQGAIKEDGRAITESEWPLFPSKNRKVFLNDYHHSSDICQLIEFFHSKDLDLMLEALDIKINGGRIRYELGISSSFSPPHKKEPPTEDVTNDTALRTATEGS